MNPQHYPAHSDDWWRVGPGKGMCRKCGEERIVSRVEDARGVQMVCDVCTNSWWVVKHGCTGE